jgi:hypothetical protein
VTYDWRIGYAEVRDADAGRILLAVVADLPRGPVRIAARPPLQVSERAPHRRACRAVGAD